LRPGPEVTAGPGTDVADLSLVEVRRVLADGELSAVEVTEAALSRAERFAGHNLFITALPERAREAAAAADRAWATGGPLGPLHGVPITVKDNIDIAGLPTTAGSSVFADRIAVADAPVVSQLRAAPPPPHPRLRPWCATLR
jgi:Asp-tRNA(Asn)/Glu-tRNA(Gln) amidotransferase A subunit family amidase